MNDTGFVSSFFTRYIPLILVVVFIVRYIARRRRTNRPLWNAARLYAIRTNSKPEMNLSSSVSISGDDNADHRRVDVENDVFDLVSLSSQKEIMPNKKLSYVSSEEEEPERIRKMEDRSSNFELTSITYSY